MEAHIAASFPEHARRVLDSGETLVATSDGFVPAVARDGACRVTVTLPRRGEEPIALRAESFGVRVRELDAEGDGAIASTAVAYTRPHGTSFWTMTMDGAEEWLHLEAGAVRAGEPVATWEIEGAGVRQAGTNIELVDEAGIPRLRVTAPEALTAGGRPIEPRLTAAGARIELWVDADGEEVLVDPIWVPAGSLATPRAAHTATLLPGGDVIVTGGFGPLGVYLTSVERFHAASTSWSSVNPMAKGRALHTATLLPTGQILVAGGKTTGYSDTKTAELYDPVADQWSPAQPMTVPRSDHTATPLLNGKVVVAGGSLGPSYLSDVEIYDPADSWSFAAPLAVGRSRHTATLLPSGKVLVTGGVNVISLASVEIYDPAADAWSTMAPLNAARAMHTATLFQDGTVVVAGGSAGGIVGLASAERSDPGVNAWSPVAPMSVSRFWHTATLLPNGKVLVVGGSGPGGSYLASAESYEPSGDVWSAAPPMSVGRNEHTATLLPDSSVLVAAGFGTTNGIASAEIYRFGLLGEPCATATDCAKGFCADDVCCDAACDAGPCDACSVAAGADVDGTCKPLTGVACDDGDACTQVDTCEAGACVGADFVTCAALDQCHVAGTCDSATGSCSNPAKPDGTTCDDGNACTLLDACQAGNCTAGPSVMCTASDECHDAGTCDPATGACSDPAKPDGTPCSNGSCSAGVCTGSSTTSSSGAGGATTSSSSGGGAGGSTSSSSSSGDAGSSSQTSSSSSSSSSSSTSGQPVAFGGCGCRTTSTDSEHAPLALCALAALTARRRRLGPPARPRQLRPTR